MERKYLQLHLFWIRIKKNKLTLIGLCILLLLIMVALFSGIIVDYKNDVIKQNMENRLQTPGKGHIFGTDAYGRDIFSRVIYGSRYSMSIAAISISLALIFGGFVGAITGYFGGILDNILMRIMDIFLAIPGIVMTIALISILGSGFINIIVAMTLANIPLFSRLTRSTVLSVKELGFVEAAKAMGFSNTRIILKYIIPNSLAPLIVQATFGSASVILLTAAMGFLGIGIQPPLPEWGAMLAQGREYIRYFPHLSIFPGLAISLVVLSLNLTGDGLRDALDPRLKS